MKLTNKICYKIRAGKQIENPLLEGIQYAIQIISKDEKISLTEKLKDLDPYVHDKSHKLIDLMKLLEIHR